jgi:hypothetical protein
MLMIPAVGKRDLEARITLLFYGINVKKPNSNT